MQNMYSMIPDKEKLAKEKFTTFTKIIHKPVSREPQFRGKCHYISTAFANEYGDELWTGYMVTKNDAMIRHSWNAKDGIVIERTPVKDTKLYSQIVKYVGKRVK